MRTNNRHNAGAQPDWDYVAAIDKLVPEAERYAAAHGKKAGEWTRAFHQRMAELAEESGLRVDTLKLREDTPIAEVTPAGHHNRRPIP